MSVTALRPMPASPWLRLAMAAGAVAVVATIALGFGALVPGTVAPPPRSPFGVGLREAGPAAGGLGGFLLAWQAAFFSSLRGALATLRDGASGPALLLGIGFAYGAFHAAGPGHGKAVVAAYIVSSERAVIRGLGISLAAALIQAVVAIGLVGIVFLVLGGTAAAMSRTAQATETAGFAMVALLGAALVWRKSAKLAVLVSGPGSGTTRVDDPCLCHPVLPAAASEGSLRHSAAVALGAGIRPCAGAIVVLTLAASYGLFLTGVAATLAMALGTALTTGLLAALAVYAKRLALRFASGRGRGAACVAAAAELAAAALVLVIGGALLAGLWASPSGA